jgi:hypothetical protein
MTSFSELGKSAKERNREYKHTIVSWLSLFQYSTSAILLALIEKPKHTKLIPSLKKTGWLQVVKTDVIGQDLLMLSKVGYAYAMENFDTAVRYQKDVKRVNHQHIRHELTLQKYALTRRGDFVDIVPAKFLDYSSNRRKIPDAVMRVKSKESSSKEALEIERWHKSVPLIYQSFYNQSLAIGRMRYYDNVTYVFPTTALMKNYQEKFNTLEWPVYEFDQKSRKMKMSDNAFNCPEVLRSRFTFTTFDFY